MSMREFSALQTPGVPPPPAPCPLRSLHCRGQNVPSFCGVFKDVAHSYGDHARFGRLDVTKKELKACAKLVVLRCV